MLRRLIMKFLSLFGIGDKEASKIHVTCIGMGNSSKFGKCLGADVDANNMYAIFKDITKDVTLLINNQATHKALIDSFLAGVNSELNVLYYSGHGGSDKFKDTGPEEVDGKDEYLCLNDTYMRDNEIWNLVNQCKGRVLLIFDCCHSETMYRTPCIQLSRAMSLAREAEGPSPKSSVSILCWSGCPDNTYSYGDQAGGILTNAIRDRYMKNKNQTYDELFNKVKNDASVLAYETPKSTKIGDGWNVTVFH